MAIIILNMYIYIYTYLIYKFLLKRNKTKFPICALIKT